MKGNLKISILWVAMIAGMSAHSLIDMIPLFWKANIAISDEGVAPMPILVLMAIVSFTIPATGLLLSLYAGKRCIKRFISALPPSFPCSVRHIVWNW